MQVIDTTTRKVKKKKISKANWWLVSRRVYLKGFFKTFLQITTKFLKNLTRTVDNKFFIKDKCKN